MMDFPLGVSMTRFLHFVQPCYVPFHSSDSDSFSDLILDSVTCHHYYTLHIFSLSFHITFLLYLFTLVIRLHSILCTYRDTFCDSTDVPTMYRSCCDLCYKPHFVLLSCDFLTTGLTHWSRV